MVSIGPSTESGGMTALTREPSGEPSVDHRRRLVDAPTDLGDDALDDAAQVVLGDEPGVGGLDDAAALDVDRVGRVDHHLADTVGSSRKRSIGPEPDHVVHDVGDEALPLARSRAAPWWSP